MVSRMQESAAPPDLDYVQSAERIASCVREYLEVSGAKGYVLGISGGLDSALTSYLLVKGVGKDRVFGLILPEKETDSRDIEDARLVAESLGIRYVVSDITGAVEHILNMFGDTYETADRNAKGNVKARIRMVSLYYYANTRNLLVAASSDRSEFLLGYFTKWGDGAGDVYPIISLYKTQARKMARAIGIPERIAGKPSSPGLWPGQSAEGELGMSYDEIDRILYMLVDKQEPIEESSRILGFPRERVEAVWRRVLANSHKRFKLQSCGV
jgi:NAD+ synthase